MRSPARSAVAVTAAFVFVATLSSTASAGVESFDDRWNASQTDAAPPPQPDAVSEAAKKNAAIDKKHAVVARDFGFQLPVGAFANRVAAMYGPLVRVAYQLTESVELGVRAGYQRGFDRQIDGETASISSIPINASFRYFALGHRSGPYAGVEAGVNLFRLRARERTSFWDVGADETWTRPCMNVALGWVYSRTFPIDVRAQIASLDLVSSGKGPLSSMTVGMTAGYSIFF